MPFWAPALTNAPPQLVQRSEQQWNVAVNDGPNDVETRTFGIRSWRLREHLGRLANATQHFVTFAHQRS